MWPCTYGHEPSLCEGRGLAELVEGKEIYAQFAKESGKPENVIQKMVDGKIESSSEYAFLSSRS
jgi:translation elongation factor EF-Ts